MTAEDKNDDHEVFDLTQQEISDLEAQPYSDHVSEDIQANENDFSNDYDTQSEEVQSSQVSTEILGPSSMKITVDLAASGRLNGVLTGTLRLDFGDNLLAFAADLLGFGRG